LFLCVDVDAGQTEALVRQASAVERDWLAPESVKVATHVLFDPEVGEAIGQTGRKVFGDDEAFLTKLLRDNGDDFGGGGARTAKTLLGLGCVSFEGKHDVEGGIAFYPPKLKGADHRVFFSTKAKRDEGVGYVHPAEVKLVGVLGGIGVEKDGGCGHGEERRSNLAELATERRGNANPHWGLDA